MESAASRPPRGGPQAGIAAPLSRRLLLLGLSATALDLASVYVKIPLGSSGLTIGDLIDFLGTYALLGCVLWVAHGAIQRVNVPGSARATALLLIAGATYALGRGIHVAANSIHDRADRVGPATLGPLLNLWDEHIGHYLADGGRSGFAVGLTLLEAAGLRAYVGSDREPAAERAPLVIGALAYGFITFANAVEGQTVPLALPFALGYVFVDLRSRWRAAPRTSVRAFFAVSSGTALALFAVWGVWHGGFPEFSHVGLIP